LPPERGGHGELVNERNAAVPESGEIGLPHDRDIADDIVTVRGDKTGAFRFRVIGQVPASLGLAVTNPRGEEPDGRLEVTFINGLDGNAGNAHGTRLPYARRGQAAPPLRARTSRYRGPPSPRRPRAVKGTVVTVNPDAVRSSRTAGSGQVR
jgi:hypothetical protein